MTADLFIRLIADAAIVPVVGIAVYVLIAKIPNNQKFAAYSRILMAGLTAYLIAKLAGTVYQPQSLRPFEMLGVEPGALYLDNPGFPSDHLLFVSAITLAVWFETRQKAVTAILIALVALISIGRVVALVHTPIDVIGGVAFAMIGALWYVQNRVEKRGEHGKNRHHRIQHH